jgi:hypothetical protein
MIGMKRALDLSDFMLPPHQPSPGGNGTDPQIVAGVQDARQHCTQHGRPGQSAAHAGVCGSLRQEGLGVSEYLPGDVGNREMRKLLAAIFAQAEKRKVA